MSEMVESQGTASVADDTQLSAPVEAADSSDSLDSVTAETPAETSSSKQAESEESAPQSEPGWIRKRVDKAVAKAVAEAEQRVAAEYEARFSPVMEKLMRAEARDLVRAGEFKTEARAMEYLQLKQGMTPTVSSGDQKAQQQNQNRDQRGRYANNDQGNADPAVQARVDMLARQAKKISEKRGIDVMAEYQSNEEVRSKIVSGEWDFYDVAEQMQGKQEKKKNTPTPVRSPNGASGSEKSTIANMTDAQFKRLQQNLKEGKRYSV